MTEKYTGGKIPKITKGSVGEWSAYDKAMEEYRFHDAVEAAWGLIREANRLVDEEKPWVLAKTDRKRLEDVLYRLLETLRHVAWMLIPLLPETAQRIFESLGVSDEISGTSYASAKRWGKLREGGIIQKGEPLFPKKE